jgi:sulfur carrier protein ThiS
MRIKLRLYGNLRRYAENRREASEMQVAEGMTVGALLDALTVPEGGWWMAAVNDQVVDPQTTLRNDDLVEVFDPVGGGCQAVL